METFDQWYDRQPLVLLDRKSEHRLTWEAAQAKAGRHRVIDEAMKGKRTMSMKQELEAWRKAFPNHLYSKTADVVMKKAKPAACEKQQANEWQPIARAPKDRRILVRTESGEIYAAHWVQNPFTGDEAFLVSEGPDGTQHLVRPIEWREIEHV